MWIDQSTGQLFFDTYDAQGQQYWYIAPKAQAGVWNTFATVIDRATGHVQAYRNNVATALTELDGVTARPNTVRTQSALTSNNPLTLGSSLQAFGFDGQIDSVSIWNTARIDSQIAADFALGIDRPLTGL